VKVFSTEHEIQRFSITAVQHPQIWSREPESGCKFVNTTKHTGDHAVKLATLKLTNNRRPTNATEEVQRRFKLVKRLQEQAELARATAAGQRYAPEKTRWVRDENGEKHARTVQKRVKQWWFATDAGRLALTVRYGSTILELAKGKYSIDVADITQMPDTITIVCDAVSAGELDTQIAAAATTLRRGFKKSSV
jgi:hypothetical protein